MSITKLYTADDLLALSDEFDVELIEGELRQMPPSDSYASYIGGLLFGPLQAHVRKHRLGFLTMEAGGFLLARAPDTVVAPDIGFVSRERLPNGPQPGEYIPFAPDLAVEVMSHTDRYAEVVRKAQRYLTAGTRVVWIVRPEEQAVVVHSAGREPLVLGIADTLDGEEAVPGFRLPLAEIFE